MGTHAIRSFQDLTNDHENRDLLHEPLDKVPPVAPFEESGKEGGMATKQGKSTDKERLHITLTPRQAQRMDYLKKRTEAGSYAEVLRNAMSLYDTLIQEVDAGGQVLVRDAQGNLISYKLILSPTV